MDEEKISILRKIVKKEYKNLYYQTAESTEKTIQ